MKRWLTILFGIIFFLGGVVYSVWVTMPWESITKMAFVRAAQTAKASRIPVNLKVDSVGSLQSSPGAVLRGFECGILTNSLRLDEVQVVPKLSLKSGVTVDVKSGRGMLSLAGSDGLIQSVGFLVNPGSRLVKDISVTGDIQANGYVKMGSSGQISDANFEISLPEVMNDAMSTVNSMMNVGMSQSGGKWKLERGAK